MQCFLSRNTACDSDTAVHQLDTGEMEAFPQIPFVLSSLVIKVNSIKSISRMVFSLVKKRRSYNYLNSKS